MTFFIPLQDQNVLYIFVTKQVILVRKTYCDFVLSCFNQGWGQEVGWQTEWNLVPWARQQNVLEFLKSILEGRGGWNYTE